MILNLITLIFLVLTILFIITIIFKQRTKENFSYENDGDFEDKIKKINEELRNTRSLLNEKTYSEFQVKNLEQIEADIQKFDKLFMNIKNALNTNNIPVCREIDLKQESVLGENAVDPCKNKDSTSCALNPFCILDKDQITNKDKCRLKDLNPACKGCIEVIDIKDEKGEVIGRKRKVKKMFLYPKVYNEIKNLK
jgi:hypothetical protein